MYLPSRDSWPAGDRRTYRVSPCEQNVPPSASGVLKVPGQGRIQSWLCAEDIVLRETASICQASGLVATDSSHLTEGLYTSVFAWSGACLVNRTDEPPYAAGTMRSKTF
ncbi:unnamed protein product [Symbiodinium sp. CCMP2592]|nr:unnamed protein product [Symbiodinium sp. CCMP2592]